jgi:hypothetical protein
VDRYTVQWCIASEGNNQQGHAFATILGGNRSTWHHNLFAHMFSRVPISRDNWKGVRTDRIWQSPTPFPAPPVQTQSAEEAFELVLKKAGATWPRRDSVDARVISQVRNGTGKIIKNENEVGGWPAYASGEPPVSTANDGIPDEWKKAHGLPLNDPGVANAVNVDGYTQLEVYLNSLVIP